jgi:cytochrome c551/c552
MPPKGGNPDLADIEVQRAVVYMTNRSGANFKEPPAPAATASAATPPATTAAAAPAATAPAPSSSTTTAAAAPGTAGATPAAATAAPSSTAKASGPLDPAAAQAMMQKDGCGACHAVDKKVKVGGVGVWGPVPMPPNSWVADGDIQALVTWILALKK